MSNDIWSNSPVSYKSFKVWCWNPVNLTISNIGPWVSGDKYHTHNHSIQVWYLANVILVKNMFLSKNRNEGYYQSGYETSDYKWVNLGIGILSSPNNFPHVFSGDAPAPPTVYFKNTQKLSFLKNNFVKFF
jgi:hypothetical protein